MYFFPFSMMLSFQDIILYAHYLNFIDLCLYIIIIYITSGFLRKKINTAKTVASTEKC